MPEQEGSIEEIFVNIPISKNVWYGITALVVAVILLFTLSSAYGSGRLAARSETVLHNQSELAKGLEYFYNDQNRYPTALEFSDRNTMLAYFNQYPATDLIGGPCTSTFVYKRITIKSFQLNYCLPQTVAGYSAGWHLVSQIK